jgi:hypothetical protein
MKRAMLLTYVLYQTAAQLTVGVMSFSWNCLFNFVHQEDKKFYRTHLTVFTKVLKKKKANLQSSDYIQRSSMKAANLSSNPD